MPIPFIAAAGSFLFSPLGKYVLIGLAVLSAYAYVDRKATYRERARCNAEKIQSQLDARNADLAIARKSEEAARAALQELNAEKTQAEAENADLKAQIDKLPVSEQCLLPNRTRRVR